MSAEGAAQSNEKTSYGKNVGPLGLKTDQENRGQPLRVWLLNVGPSGLKLRNGRSHKQLMFLENWAFLRGFGFGWTLRIGPHQAAKDALDFNL